MSKRSPRYPRIGLGRAVELARRLYGDVHTSKVDVESAAKVLGYTNATSGAAAVAIGSMRQFGLVDGLRGDISVSDLAMRILQPMDSGEHATALHEAAKRPDGFSSVLNQFAGRLPTSNDPIKAFLIRQEGFSPAGADDLISTLRETLEFLPPLQSADTKVAREPEAANEGSSEAPSVQPAVATANDREAISQPLTPDFILRLPIGGKSGAEVRISGRVTQKGIDRLIKHLELIRDDFEEDDEV